MTECCESIVEICFTIFSGSGFFTVLLYAPSMAKLRDEEFNFCNKIVILNVRVHSWLYVNISIVTNNSKWSFFLNQIGEKRSDSDGHKAENKKKLHGVQCRLR